jgi:hypothetical protein
MRGVFRLEGHAGRSSAVRVAGRDMGFESDVGRVPIELSLDLLCPERDGH